MKNNLFYIVEYPDYFSLDNGKKIKSSNLGEKFALLNSFFLDYLKEYHIPTGLIRSAGDNTLKYTAHTRFPFCIKILNSVDSRMSPIFLKDEGDPLKLPVYEIYYPENSDFLINESHLIAFDLCTMEEIKIINRLCSKINAVLKSFFERRNLFLLSVTCFFGKKDNKIIVVDDFTPKSLKIKSLNGGENKIEDPFDITTANKLKKYTDNLINILSC